MTSQQTRFYSPTTNKTLNKQFNSETQIAPNNKLLVLVQTSNFIKKSDARGRDACSAEQKVLQCSVPRNSILVSIIAKHGIRIC